MSERETTWTQSVNCAVETDATNIHRLGNQWIWNPYNYTPGHTHTGVWGRYARMAVATRTQPPGWPMSPIIGHERWFLRDAAGTPLTWPGYGGTIVDLTLPAGRDYLAQWLYEFGQQSGCEWVCWDEGVARVGNSAIDDGYHAPSVGAVPTPVGASAWFDAEVALFAAYRAIPGHKPVCVNVACHPDTIAADWARMIPHVEGLLHESGFSEGELGIGENRSRRARNIFTALRAALDAGRTVLYTTHEDRTEAMGRLLSAVRAQIANSGDELRYLWQGRLPPNGDYAPRAWDSWADRLGTPVGPVRWIGNVSLRFYQNYSADGRPYLQGYAIIDWSKSPPAVAVSVNGGRDE